MTQIIMKSAGVGGLPNGRTKTFVRNSNGNSAWILPPSRGISDYHSGTSFFRM